MLQPDVQLISVNDHLMETPEIWSDGVTGKLAERLPTVVRVDGAEHWQIGSYRKPVAGLGIVSRPELSGRATTIDEMDRAVCEPEARVAAMDLDGVAVQTLAPNIIGFAGERLRFLDDLDTWGHAVTAYNDFVLGEFCRRGGGRFVGTAILPLADHRAAAAEVTRAATLGAKGIAFPHDPESIGLEPFRSAAWRPVMAAMEETGLPLFLHIGPGGGGPNSPPASYGAFLNRINLDAIASLIEVVYSGMLLEHPRLRVVMTEAGVAWLPYLAERMDFFNKRPGAWPFADRVERPSELVGENVFGTFLDDPAGIRWRHDVGVKQILWQSDYPHGDSFFPHSRRHLEAALVDVPDDEAAAIAHDNAADLFGLVGSNTDA